VSFLGLIHSNSHMHLFILNLQTSDLRPCLLKMAELQARKGQDPKFPPHTHHLDFAYMRYKVQFSGVTDVFLVLFWVFFFVVTKANITF
jgi:hypothetical protein